MMKKQFIKYTCFVLFLGLFMICLNPNQIQASTNAENVVREYVQAMDKHDWNKFTNLHCEEEKESLQYYFTNPINKTEHTGVLNVKNASLTELVEINLIDAKDMLYKEYDENNTKVFVFGVDYDVYEDSKYYSSGVNYNFISCVKENDNWKIAEMIPIENPERLLECGYEFTDNFNTAIYVMNARKNGYFINYEGELFASLEKEDCEKEAILPYAVLNKRTIPTSNTIVRYLNSNGKIKKPYFHDYCLGVLAGELRGSEFNGAVRKAQAIAIKTFTWHYLIIPFGGTAGYDVRYDLQSYKPDKISENPKVTKNYNAVKSVWMESYGGAIFTAYYKAGVYSNPSKFKNGGEFKQQGARWLYDNGVVTKYKGLLKYFYNSSSASTGGAIRFFDDNKNEL